MKNSRVIRVAVLLTAGVVTGAAAVPPSVHWSEICSMAGVRELSITTQAGETVQGYCTTINVDEIVVATKDRQLVKIARSALARLRVRRSATRGHALTSLGRGMREGLRTGLGWLLSPAAPLGIVVVPGTLAWGAVAAPFCLMGDLGYRIGGTEEINVL